MHFRGYSPFTRSPQPEKPPPIMDSAQYLFHVPLVWDTTGDRWTAILTYAQQNDLQVVENAILNILYIYDEPTCNAIREFASKHGTHYVVFKRL